MMARRDHPYRRKLLPGQTCRVMTYGVDTGATTEVYRSDDILLEAPNWTAPGTLVLNGDGILWSLDLASGVLSDRDVPALPFLNNDHVPGPDCRPFYVSGYDWHIHAVDFDTGETRQVTRDDPDRPMFHFLHGVSPSGDELAFVGIEPAGPDNLWGPANIYTVASSGGALRQLTFGDKPADGSEYSPDGAWIYFNTEAFSVDRGHAQIARVRRAGGPSEQLTFDERVNWFPHLAPDGRSACYLSYPPGTFGHPENLPVEIKLVRDDRWAEAETVTALFGGQGTINVNSWSPDGRSFAFVEYPLASHASDAAGDPE